jgi:L-glyceraldehyde 3-phosphate reductase
MPMTDSAPLAAFATDRYDRMPYRRCGQWGLKLPAISLGAWETFGGYRDADVARACMYRAFDLGITHFDLANNYGRPAGNAETVVGRIVRSMPRDELILSTKAGYRMWPGPYGEWGSRKYILASLDQSLQRLGVDYVDLFYHHRPDPDTPLEETLGALDQAVRSGKALYAAVSNYSGARLAEAHQVLRENRLAPVVLHQPCYNLLRRGIETDLLPVAREHGTGVIAFCPLAQGLLTSKYLDGIPADSRAALWWGEDGSRRVEEVLPKVKALHAIAQARGQSLAQMALCWILRLPEVTSALIGASRVGQIEENVAALSAPPFTAEELSQIDRALTT